jgi:transmembrane sensor
VIDRDEQQEDIERAAAEWLVRLGGKPLNQAERAEFDGWLANPAHRAAFDRASQAWSDLDVLKGNPGKLRSVIAPAAKPSRGGIKRSAIVGGLALLIVGLGAFYRVGNPWIALTADYRTGPGEVRTVRLIDGTIVDLGSSSALAVDYNHNVRRVRLLSGEAYFTVAPKEGPEQRPFTAVAEGGTVTALGTAFAVEDTGDSAVVTAVEHTIEVVPPASAKDASRAVLSPGDTVQFNGTSGLGAVQQTDVTAATAWRRGLLVFNDMPLSEVVARLNRYRRGRIMVMNGALANRRVSGVFASNNLDNVVETISTELGARAVSAPPLVTLLF